MTYVKPLEYLKFEYSPEDEIHHYKNKYFDIPVTPNHKMLYKENIDSNKWLL